MATDKEEEEVAKEAGSTVSGTAEARLLSKIIVFKTTTKLGVVLPLGVLSSSLSNVNENITTVGLPLGLNFAEALKGSI